jgi:ornithine carbamoyltransferase
VEVMDEVLDSDLSAVTLQARNRLYTQMAILRQLFSD